MKSLLAEKIVDSELVKESFKAHNSDFASAIDSPSIISEIFEFSGDYSRFDRRFRALSLMRGLIRHVMELSTVKMGVIEAIISVVALALASKFSFIMPFDSRVFLAAALSSFLATSIIGLNERKNYINFPKLASAQLVCVLLTTLGMVLFSNMVLYSPVARKLLLVFACIYGTLSLLPKMVVCYLASRTSVKLLWVGSHESAVRFNNLLTAHGNRYQLVGYWNGSLPAGVDRSDLDYMLSLYRSLDVDQIVLSRDAADFGNVLEYCYKAAQAGCTIVDETTFLEDAFEQVPVEQINENWFFQSHITVNGHFQDLSKRIIDIAVSLSVLTLGLPIFCLIWLAVRLTGGKKVFFTQERMGQFGVPFKMYKFRTMTVGSENRNAWTQKRDIRITKVGRFLRRTRLDELPQFWNVLKGDMSVVGPRPEIPELVKVIERDVPYFSFRCWSRPGITGMAQIRYRYCSDISDAREKLKYDLYYIKNWSIMMDIQIMLRTITALMHGSR